MFRSSERKALILNKTFIIIRSHTTLIKIEIWWIVSWAYKCIETLNVFIKHYLKFSLWKNWWKLLNYKHYPMISTRIFKKTRIWLNNMFISVYIFSNIWFQRLVSQYRSNFRTAAFRRDLRILSLVDISIRTNYTVKKENILFHLITFCFLILVGTIGFYSLTTIVTSMYSTSMTAYWRKVFEFYGSDSKPFFAYVSWHYFDYLQISKKYSKK